MKQKGLIGILASALAVLMALTVALELLVWPKHQDTPNSGLPQNTTLENNDQTQQDPPDNSQEEDRDDPPEEDPKDPTPQPLEFVLSFAGDCTLGDDYDWYMGKDGFLSVVDGDYAYPMQNALPYFEDDDFTIVNFEGVLSGWLTPEDKPYQFRAPVAYAQVLTEGSIEAVTLANNHVYDYGNAGYISTKQALSHEGVVYTEHNSTALFYTERGLVIGLYATQFWMDIPRMQTAVESLRSQGAHIVVVSYHGGIEGSYRPTADQINFAHAAIDAGADIFFGHHPHVLQPIEHYNGGLIMYSLGNFSFGGNPYPRDYDTAVIQQKVILDPDGTVRLGQTVRIPFRFSSSSGINDYCPAPYEFGTAEYFRVLSKLSGEFDGPDLMVDYPEQKEDEDADLNY